MTTPDPVRSRTMRAVRSTNTKPEMIVRRLAHAMGYRFRLHRKDLPGSPDLVFPSRKTAIFVHGCFWHGHNCSRGARKPKDNAEYWVKKIGGNVARDQRSLLALSELGWRTLVVWECSLRDKVALETRLRTFLESSAAP